MLSLDIIRINIILVTAPNVVYNITDKKYIKFDIFLRHLMLQTRSEHNLLLHPSTAVGLGK